jgi:hypothetical protein
VIRSPAVPALIVACGMATTSQAARAQSSLPDRSVTPGAINPAVTQDDIQSTICVRGWTRTVRPPERYTYRLKREQIRQREYADRRLGHYEEDPPHPPRPWQSAARRAQSMARASLSGGRLDRDDQTGPDIGFVAHVGKTVA